MTLLLIFITACSEGNKKPHLVTGLMFKTGLSVLNILLWQIYFLNSVPWHLVHGGKRSVPISKYVRLPH
jgi:hypothetical protein